MYSIIMVQAGTYVQHHNNGASRYVCTASLWCKQVRMYSIIMVQAGTYVQHHMVQAGTYVPQYLDDTAPIKH